MTSKSGILFGASAQLAAGSLADVAALAVSVDCNSDADRRPILRQLAADGLLDLGLPGSQGTYLDQVRVIAELASACMTTAFSAWAHRMTVEYLSLFVDSELEDIAQLVRTAQRPGSTALASTFRAAGGQAELTVTSTALDAGHQAEGFIPWASNLYEDAVIVTGILDDGIRRMAVLDRASEGITVNDAVGLLALDATRSGSIVIDKLTFPANRFLPVDFGIFVKNVRPTFLVFQTALCLGLAAASLAAIEELRGVGVSLAPQVDERRAELARLSSLTEQAARWLDARDEDLPFNIVKLRLDAAHLTTAATQLELMVRGGAAYSAQSATARRVREALFLPVQSPTEAQLQWELQHSA